MIIHKFDELLQKEMPTVMVPKYGDLEPCPMGKSRLLMGRDGLYLETLQPWGRLVRNLWVSQRPLPYGEVEEVDTFQEVFIILKEKGIMAEMTSAAAEYAGNDKEWMGWVVYDPVDESFDYQPLSFNSTATSLDWNARKNGKIVAVDIHSHGHIHPFFSSTDNKDDIGGVRISIVIGDYRGEGESDQFHFVSRYCVEGFWLPSLSSADIDEVSTEGQEDLV